MTQLRNKQLAPLVVCAAALIGAGAAYAATRLHSSPSSSPRASGPLSGAASISANSGGHGPGHGRPGGRGDKIAVVTTYLGITEAQLMTQLQAGKTLAQVADATSGKSAAGLIDAIVAAEKTEIAAAVTAGRITQTQADQIIAGLKAHVTAEVNSTRPARGPGGHEGRGHGPGGDDFAAAATYLGLTEAALTTQLQAGKTLAQVADATSGKSAAGLIDALVAHETTEVDAALKAGTITQAQRDAIVAGLKARFTALANGTRPPHDDHHHGGLKPGYMPRMAPASGTHI
jgi:hypothetical protein